METQTFLVLDLYPLVCALTALPLSIISMYGAIVKKSAKYALIYLLSYFYFIMFVNIMQVIDIRYRQEFTFDGYITIPVEETIQRLTSDIQLIADTCNVSYNYCIIVIYILLPIFILSLIGYVTYLVYKHVK